jgi:hypothetical protein
MIRDLRDDDAEEAEPGEQQRHGELREAVARHAVQARATGLGRRHQRPILRVSA